ncbi:MAG TPA: sigma-70 family RNA polymerase sigma factor [Phycisphaerae bacterium]|jgi:RNA polymerase sigma-70 factor (ECF subfamily)
MTRLSEDELIARSIAGDQAALERLLMLHHVRLCAELAQRLPSRVRGFVNVDDAVQEAYISVFREIGTFRPQGPGAFYAWLVQIARRKLLDAVKAERTAKRGGAADRAPAVLKTGGGSIVEWLDLLAVHEHTPSRSLARREALELLQNAMAGLKPEYQEALRLRYLEGLSVAEAAARMNRTEGALCLLCHRALRQLETLLGDSAQFFHTRA